jgi:aryl-alcohol dehydrogenase-like predicted oxidoreductase
VSRKLLPKLTNRATVTTDTEWLGYRAQTWHDPKDVERALDVSLKDLQLDYGNSMDSMEEKTTC